MRIEVSLLLLVTALSLIPISSGSIPRIAAARATVQQAPIGRGRFLSPSRGESHGVAIPFTIRWQVDDPTQVESQDLILSTDGGATFESKIAAHLPPGQQQLIWGAAPHNATARGKLKLGLRLRNGGIDQVVSDDFSIPAAPAGAVQSASVSSDSLEATPASSNVQPAFADPGSCVSGTLPTLNYNMNNSVPCSAFYGGEQSLAQDPNDPSHFHTVSAFSGRINSTSVNWQFGGSASVNGVDVLPYAARGDMTTEIGRDGTVYVVSMAATGFQPTDPVDRIVILRSRNGGVTFEPAVSIPGLPVPVIDKPVVAVHPNDAQTLVITFQKSSGGSAVETWLAICNAAATGDLSSATNWSFIHPMRSSNPTDLLIGSNTVHPLIDPVSSTSTFYWLFIVYTNDDFGGGAAGISIFKYQITNRSYTIDNGGAPIEAPFTPPLGYPLWTNSNIACTSIEDALRVSESCAKGRANLTKAAIDYCDPNAHRMYIPTLVNTVGRLDGGLTSDLFVTVWQYTGTPVPQCPTGTCTTRILPLELHKYAACAATDGHGRVWINCYAVGSAAFGGGNYQKAQMGAFSIDRITGAAGAVAYNSAPVPSNPSIPSPVFLGDYVYTQATYYPTSGGSRISSPSWTDIGCSGAVHQFNDIGLAVTL